MLQMRENLMSDLRLYIKSTRTKDMAQVARDAGNLKSSPAVLPILPILSLSNLRKSGEVSRK